MIRKALQWTFQQSDNQQDGKNEENKAQVENKQNYPLNRCTVPINQVIWSDPRICYRRETSPSPMRKSDKLMNYWEHRGQQTKSESNASKSLLHPICSQRIPPKIDSLLTQPDTLCEGEKEGEIKGQRMGDRGLHLPIIWAEAVHWAGSHSRHLNTYKNTTYTGLSNGIPSDSK